LAPHHVQLEEGTVPEEFGGDLTGAVFWGADLRGAHFRDVDLTGTRISHAWLVDVEIDALVEGVVINGVDVTAYVNERDPWFPLRAMLRADEPISMLATWSAIQTEWSATIGMARALPEERLHDRVDDEWSFVETLRHLVFAMDKWFTLPVLGEPFHASGLPNTGSVDFPWPGLDERATLTVAEALDVRADRVARFADYLSSVTIDDLSITVEVLENGPHSVKDCIHTVFEEEFWHNRYARRDLELLRSGD
jgi:hypothetical protein